MLVIIDHYDSFCDMIADYASSHDCSPQIIKTDQIPANLIDYPNLKLIFGPGPGHPKNSELKASLNLLAQAITAKIPILGICLGHQMIAYHFKTKIIRSKKIAHGLVSQINHINQGVFCNLPSNFLVTRYHSLIIDPKTLHPDLVITAKTQANEIMAIKHQTLPLEGIQFHPESVKTQYGKELLANFLL